MTTNDRQDRPTQAYPAEMRRAIAEPSRLTASGTAGDTSSRTALEAPEALGKKLAECSRLLNLSASGLVVLDKSGLIDSANPRAAEMFGADRSYLLKKPISLFINPEDQAAFYLCRSRIIAGTQNQPFEIKIKKKDGCLRSVRINAQPVEIPNQNLPGMLLALEDITAYREALDALQLKEYFDNLLFSVLDDLAVWPTADIDAAIRFSLEKIGLVSGAKRVYVGLFHDRGARFSVTHEWLDEGVKALAPMLLDVPAATFSTVVGRLKTLSTVSVDDTEDLAAQAHSVHTGLHASGTRSFLMAPLAYGRLLTGMVGCDAVGQPVAWPPEIQRLVKCVGSAIVNALVRRQVESVPAAVRATLVQFVTPAAPDSGDEPMEYDGPIEFMDAGSANVDAQPLQWRFETGAPEDLSLINTVLLKDGKTANLACRHCNRMKTVEIAEIRAMGTHQKVTCICGQAMYIKIELRREHRRIVDLDGLFIRERGDRSVLQSGDWGKIRICNLSRHGIGFTVFGKPDVRADDLLRVKFTLDNTAGSNIQKTVKVRSVTDGIIGGQFVGQDPCDVTLGFYLLT